MKFDPEAYENMTDEERDEYYRPKKKNSRKTLLPLFIYLILQRYTDDDHPMSQQQLLERLAAHPYELTVERKALSRALHTMEEDGVGIVTDGKNGAWYGTRPW